MPKVRIVAPDYKVSKYLERCMDSLRSQTIRDHEIILVGDGSPDSCPPCAMHWLGLYAQNHKIQFLSRIPGTYDMPSVSSIRTLLWNRQWLQKSN